MQVITVDLKKNPEIADFLADKEPGDEVCLFGSIKSLDDQTCVLTVGEMGDGKMDDEEKETETDGENADRSGQEPGDIDSVGGESVRDVAGAPGPEV